MCCSMEQLDDDQVEQLMLETEGFDILEDAKTPTKNPTLPPAASQKTEDMRLKILSYRKTTYVLYSI